MSAIPLICCDEKVVERVPSIGVRRRVEGVKSGIVWIEKAPRYLGGESGDRGIIQKRGEVFYENCVRSRIGIGAQTTGIRRCLRQIDLGIEEKIGVDTLWHLHARSGLGRE